MYHILNWNTGLTEDDQFLEEILQYIKGFLDQEQCNCCITTNTI